MRRPTSVDRHKKPDPEDIKTYLAPAARLTREGTLLGGLGRRHDEEDRKLANDDPERCHNASRPLSGLQN